MSRRILLADDSVTIQKVIELTFMDDDYEVRAVGNGDEALAMLTALQVDFVIADVHMPGATGYEVCRRSKQLLPHVPVLLLVGTFEPFDEAQARECGADSYLKKPFDSQELLGRVHDLLGGSQAATPPTVPAAPPAAAAPEPALAGAVPGFAAPAPAAPPAATAAPPAPHPVAVPPVEAAAIEPAASWQEFELEAEPVLIPEPWQGGAAAAPAPPAAGPGAAPGAAFEQPFALGDLDEHEEQVAEPLPAGAAGAAGATGAAVAAGAAGLGGAAATAAVPSDLPFTLDGLDERGFELDDAPAEPGPVERLTHAEPVAPPHWAAPSAPPAPAPALEERAGAPLDQSPFTANLAATEGQVARHAGHPAFADAGAGAAALEFAGEAGTAGQDLQALRASTGPAAAPEGAEALEPLTALELPPLPPLQPAPAVAAPAPEAAPAHGAAGGNGQPAAGAGAALTEGLSDADVERIARRVVELIGDRVVRDVAWEVIPDLAEVVIKDRLRELESQVE